MNIQQYLIMSLNHELIMLSPENKKGERVRVKLIPKFLKDDGSFIYDLYKPALRPISDLNKLILHKGEMFLPKENLLDIDLIEKGSDYRMLRHGDVDRLIMWHFDIFGLIEREEAIDIKTLKINPYT